MSTRLLGGLTLKELGCRTWREIQEDNVVGSAAELAYYFMLALFPMLIFLVSLVGFIPGVREQILQGLSNLMPADATNIVRNTVDDVVGSRNGRWLSFGLFGALWAMSSGAIALMRTLNEAYDVAEKRSFVKRRLVALGVTLSLSLLIVGGASLIVFSNRFDGWLAGVLKLNTAHIIGWDVLNYTIGLSFILLGIEIIYYFAPSKKRLWQWITPGAIFAVVASVIVSLLLSLYLRMMPSHNGTYGGLSAVVALMLWLYLVGLVVLIGGEINSEVENAAAQCATKDWQSETKSSKSGDNNLLDARL